MGAMTDHQEESNVSRAMLNKLSKQQHLLLRELERTKRRLREEIWKREGRTADAPPADHYQAARSIRSRGASRESKSNKALLSPTRYESHLSPTIIKGVGRGPAKGTCLKRSRSEAGMSCVENDAEGVDKAKVVKPEGGRHTPCTRIDMLPVMSSTGDPALEVGLTNFPAGRGWTAQPPRPTQGETHMLPVFRLPEVSESPAGKFLKRLPREETLHERGCRLAEEEELSKMKAALGLTDRELAALEEELLAGGERGWKASAVTSRPVTSSSENDLDILEKGSSAERLYGPGALERHRVSSISSASGKRRRRQSASSGRDGGQGHTYRERRRAGSRRPEVQSMESNVSTPVNCTDLDFPTPRVLRRKPYPTLGAELAASAASTMRCPGKGTNKGAWISTCDISLKNTAGTILGTTTAVTTEQLAAATAGLGLANVLELRRELGRSVGQVRRLAQAVKADVQEVTRICPIQNPRAVRFLRRWACERLAILADEINISRTAAALDRWRRAVAAMSMEERKQAYFRYQGTSKLLFSLKKAHLRRLAKGWLRWNSFVAFERAEERRALETSAAITIQRAVRGFSARRLRAWLKIVAQDRQRHEAAVAITVCAKGKVARMRYQRGRADVEKARAAGILRRVGRGMMGRKKAKLLREERARLQVAVGLQKLYRGRLGRRLFLTISKDRRERLAATRIQAATRGMWGRQQAESVSRKVRDAAAAGYILRAARAWLARRLVQRLREEELRSRSIRSIAALNVQRTYRGHRSRVLHGARLEIKRSLHRAEHTAATKIQALVRGHLSKRVVAKLAAVRQEKRVSDARQWTETWSEDAQAWFYYNAQTGEALWEPPRTGYTKHTGSLVLASGEVVTDPLEGMTEEERLEAKKQASCVECEQKRATRKCDQCGDGYCTRCFRRTHATGRRAKHSWTHVGPMECAECEAEVAIKWCTACDDPFCGPCWSTIHSRGKRSLHSYCNISPGGRVSTKAMAPDGSDAGPFTPGDSLVAETMGGGGGAGGDGGGGGGYESYEGYEGYEVNAAHQGYEAADGGSLVVDGMSGVSDWQEFVDDQGNPYWYSSTTGSSQYENPYAPAWSGDSAVTSGSMVPYAADAQDGSQQQWGWGAEGEEAYVYPQSGALTSVESSGGEWSEHLDDEGRSYYYSSVTGESQYEIPTALQTW